MTSVWTTRLSTAGLKGLSIVGFEALSRNDDALGEKASPVICGIMRSERMTFAS